MLTQNQIQQLVNDIAEGYKPEKIYLFGSYANGIPNKDSDIDLFIIKETNERWMDRRSTARASIKDYIAPMDIIVYTPTELESAMQLFHNIGKIAVNTGKLVYERV